MRREEAAMAVNPGKRGNRGSARARIRRRCALALLGMAAGLVVLAAFRWPVYRVVGDSMAETLRDGDVVVAAQCGAVRGAVAVCECGGSTLLGRIIALGGDTVLVSIDGAVLVNGRALDEPYLAERALGYCDLTMPVTVPEGCAFIMGDNRAESMDSRCAAVGCIQEDQIAVCVLARLWPIRDFKLCLSIEQLWRNWA